MLSFPNAKINLGLQITHKRTDGYHDLNTIFLPIPYTDALELIPSFVTTFGSIGLPIMGEMKDNLVLKAYNMLKEDFPNLPSFQIILQKNIAMGAGLGGGSSDAAFMLRMLNDAYGLGLSKERLLTYALSLGSDCPFFLYNEPCFATGRGEVLEPIQIDALEDYSLMLILPNIHISTAKAFSGITPKEATYNLKDINNLGIEEWKDHIYNDFEESVFPLYPVLKAIKDELYAQGAIYAAMTGTGAAMYAIMPKGKAATIEHLDGEQHFFNHIVVK